MDDEPEIIDSPLFTPGQYDLLTVGKPEKKRVKPASELVVIIRRVLDYAADRDLYMLAGKLLSDGVTPPLLGAGMDRLVAIPYWEGYVNKMRSAPITLLPRIEQAASHAEQEDCKAEMYDLLLELRARRARGMATEQRLVRFMQSIHSSSPIMKKYIKTAAEQVVRAAFIANPSHGATLIDAAIDRLSVETTWINRQIDQCRVPKETAQKLTQIIAQLSEAQHGIQAVHQDSEILTRDDHYRKDRWY